MIFFQLNHQLQLIEDLLTNLSDTDYSRKITHLGNASIGGHTRHIIELLQCAVNGYEKGVVDYVKRKRNLQIETDKVLAKQLISTLRISCNRSDKMLAMATNETEGITDATVSTTYFREVVYNTEHIIHHLALIKVALLEIKLDIVDEDFGMAYSTLKYRSTLNEVNGV